MSIKIDRIVVSDKFNYNKDGFKHFIDYQKGKIVRPLCIILSQMSGYIKYFEYGGYLTKCKKNTINIGI